MRKKTAVCGMIGIMCVVLCFGFLLGGGKADLEPNEGVVNLNFLTTDEKEVIKEMNLARSNPAGYAQYLIDFKRYYINGTITIAGQTPIRTQEGVAALDEAVEYLKKTAACKQMKVSRGLSWAAEAHALDQGPKGAVGHDGSDGSKPDKRMLRFGKIQGCWGENLAYGEYTPRQVVMQLIIDDGVPSRGHRKNIFDPNYGVVGVAFRDHDSYGTMCVIDFTCAFAETTGKK